MALNQDCIREIMLYVDENLPRSADGSVKRGLHFRAFMDQGKYSPVDINISIVYLAEKGMLRCPNPDSKTAHIQCDGLTAKGLDYLQVIKNETLWNKLVSKYGDVFKDSAVVAIETILTFLLSHVG